MATEYVCVYVCIHPVFSKGTYTYLYMHVGKHKRQLMEVEDALNRTHGMCAGMCPWRAAGKVRRHVQQLVLPSGEPYVDLSICIYVDMSVAILAQAGPWCCG